jgi:hypothetical protein
MTTTTALTQRIYTHQALQQTIEVFANICTASFTAEHDAYVLQITAPQRQICDEFLNYALSLSAQELLR